MPKNSKVNKSYFENLTLSEGDFYNKELDELIYERIPTAIMATIVLKFFKFSKYSDMIEIDRIELNNLLCEIKIIMDLFIKSGRSFKDLEELANMLLG